MHLMSTANDMLPVIESRFPAPFGEKIGQHAAETGPLVPGYDRLHASFQEHVFQTRREHSAHIAQAVEHSLGKGEVTGSSPVMGTIP